MIFMSKSNPVLKLELKRSEIESIIECLKFQPQNIYEFLNYAALVEKLTKVLKENE